VTNQIKIRQHGTTIHTATTQAAAETWLTTQGARKVRDGLWYSKGETILVGK
jgi:hypothetical protein